MSDLVEKVAKAIRNGVELCDYCGEVDTSDSARAAIAVVLREVIATGQGDYSARLVACENNISLSDEDALDHRMMEDGGVISTWKKKSGGHPPDYGKYLNECMTNSGEPDKTYEEWQATLSDEVKE